MNWLRFIHRYDIYILWFVLAAYVAVPWVMGQDRPIGEYLFVATDLMLVWVGLFLYTRGLGCRWMKFNDDLREDFEDLFRHYLPSDFKHVPYLDFLLPRIYKEVRRTTRKGNSVQTIKEPRERYIKLKRVRLDGDSVYLDFSLTCPHATEAFIKAPLVPSSKPLLGRPSLEVLNKVRKGHAVLDGSLYIGSFNPLTCAHARAFTLKRINAELFDGHTLITLL